MKYLPKPSIILSISFISPFLAVFGLASNGSAQPTDARPAILVAGPKSLINVLDAQRIMKRGQKDAVVSFSLGITSWGDPAGMLTYQGSPDSKILSQELLDQADRAKFIPARYAGQPAGAIVNGTLVFAIVNGTPRLRLFLNQDREHLKRGDDFVAPQWIIPINATTKWFDSDRYYREEGGMVAARINVDAHGKLQSSKVMRVHPSGAPFGMEVAKHIGAIVFSPAYLNGRPVACSTTWLIPFSGPYGRKRWL